MDLTPVSAPLTKLIEVAARGIGVIYEPVHIVRMAKAHAKAEMILAETDDKLGGMDRKSVVGPVDLSNFPDQL